MCYVCELDKLLDMFNLSTVFNLLLNLISTRLKRKIALQTLELRRQFYVSTLTFFVLKYTRIHYSVSAVHYTITVLLRYRSVGRL